MTIEEKNGKYTLKLDLGDNGGTVTFRNPAAAQKWINAQNDFWVWVRNAENRNDKRVATLQQNVIAVLDLLMSAGSEWEREVSAGNDPKAAVERLEKNFDRYNHKQPQSRILHSETAAAIAVDIVCRTTGSFDGLVALGYALEQIGPRNWALQYLRGVTLFEVYCYGPTPAGIKTHKAKLLKLEGQGKTVVDGLLDRAVRHEEVLDTQGERAEGILEGILDLYAKEKERILDLYAKEKVAAEASRTQIVDTFRNAMSLEAPRHYWRKKSESHAWWMKVCGYALLLYLGLVLTGTGVAYVKHAPITLDSLKGLELPMVGLIALGIGIIIAMARMLYRLFLSQLHLYNDAAERVTMIETYLALKEGGHAEPQWLEVLYRRIFAPASDGVVRDDIAPVTPGEALAQLGRKLR